MNRDSIVIREKDPKQTVMAKEVSWALILSSGSSALGGFGELFLGFGGGAMVAARLILS